MIHYIFYYVFPIFKPDCSPVFHLCACCFPNLTKIAIPQARLKPSELKTQGGLRPSLKPTLDCLIVCWDPAWWATSAHKLTGIKCFVEHMLAKALSVVKWARFIADLANEFWSRHCLNNCQSMLAQCLPKKCLLEMLHWWVCMGLPPGGMVSGWACGFR